MNILQGLKELFHGGGGGDLSKNVGHHGWPTTKNKKKHWLKRPKAVPKFILGIQRFYIRPHVHEFFFNFQIFKQKVSKPTKICEKDHSVSLKKPHSFYELQLT